ncbi:hypothetical protein FHS99_003447 [Sphingomonas prati]|uniref:Uncharacterized protein n=1 Tax=Sphingomonas prati TaxID=1843237 RepID=A0A7W9F4I0_9SPHN|nr:hypothetical protein [Sphingomonas prati]
MGKGFLAPALFLAQTAYVATEASANIHASAETPLQTINLQTMRDNVVDCPVYRSIVPVTHQRQGTLCIDSISDGAAEAEWPRQDV